ncbi:MAG: hypothetical protein Q3971_03965 [Moraxella sp.]|nr:hypothetical protein [Moraxella sp.]
MNRFIDSHNRTFWGNFRTSGTWHFSLVPTPVPNGNNPTIDVAISIQGDTLQLSYFISKHGLVLDEFITPIRADFLWQKTCLECFFDVGQSDYIEMNFTPQGEYNLYHFDDYRTPNALPPVWADGLVFMVDGVVLDNFYTYHLSIKSDNTPIMNVHKINPTAILYEHGEPIFYAVQHKSPPDFHDKTFWQKIKPT